MATMTIQEQSNIDLQEWMEAYSMYLQPDFQKAIVESTLATSERVRKQSVPLSTQPYKSSSGRGDVSTGIVSDTHATKRGFFPHNSTSKCDSPHSNIDPQELKELENVERTLALKYGLNFEDPTAISLEAKRQLSNAERVQHQFQRVVNNLERLKELRIEQENEPRAPLKIGTCSRFWAVLIGIDAYIEYPLYGSVADAELMRDYLITDLGVPMDHIVSLLGRRGANTTTNHSSILPTRDNIINEFWKLVDNKDIQKNDHIIIYFSGHGSSYSKHQCLSEANIRDSMEALCPMDRDSDTSYTSGPIKVPDICDREFNTILSKIKLAKETNITVILDCCHSGGAARAPSEAGVNIRAIPSQRASAHPVRAMLNAAYDDLKRFPAHGQGVSLGDSNWQPDIASSVFFAACAEHQKAEEKEGRNGYHGLFTDDLVEVLRSETLDKDVTFAGLHRSLRKWRHQTPVVFGTRQHDCLWYLD